MRVVVDVLHAVAMIAAAAGAIAEFQLRICDIGAAADGAFVAVGLFAGAGLVVLRPVGIGSLLIFPVFPLSLRGAIAEEAWQNVFDVASKEENIIEKRDEREAARNEIDERHRVHEAGAETCQQAGTDFPERHENIEPCQIFGFDRDDIEEQEFGFRCDGGIGEEQAEVQVVAGSLHTGEHTGNVHHQYTAEIITVEPEGAPILLQLPADAVIDEEQQEGEQQVHAAGAGHLGEDVGKEPPDLSVQNGGAVKVQIVVKKIAGVDEREEVDDQIAHSHIEHQIGNALAAVAVKESGDLPSEIFHGITS